MLLFTVAPTTTLSEGQIQRNFAKLAFVLTGAKAGGVASGAQLLTDAAQTYVTLKRISQSLGEKSIFPRVSLAELLNATLGIQGYARTSGADAAANYSATFAVEISLFDNIDVAGGDYLALTIENPTLGLTIAVSGLAVASKGHDHMKITKTTLQANESKRVDVSRADFVVISKNVSDLRLVGDDTASLTNDSLDKLLIENSAFIVNIDGGSTVIPNMVVIPAHSIDYIDCTNGNTANNILIIRQTDY